MAEEADEQAENALNKIVNKVEESINMRETLKQLLFETLSTLGLIISKQTDSWNRKIKEIEKLKKQLDEMGTELNLWIEKLDKSHIAPSLDEV